VNLNETALELSAAQIRSSKKMLTWQWHHFGGLKWQCIVNCRLL